MLLIDGCTVVSSTLIHSEVDRSSNARSQMCDLIAQVAVRPAVVCNALHLPQAFCLRNKPPRLRRQHRAWRLVTPQPNSRITSGHNREMPRCRASVPSPKTHQGGLQSSICMAVAVCWGYPRCSARWGDTSVLLCGCAAAVGSRCCNLFTFFNFKSKIM